MTLDEAIKRQEEIIRTGTLGDTLTAYRAMLLGSEALKRLQHYRTTFPTYRERPLPGETED